MENTADDPRQFAAAAEVGGLPDAGIPPGVDTLFRAHLSVTILLNGLTKLNSNSPIFDGSRNGTAE